MHAHSPSGSTVTDGCVKVGVAAGTGSYDDDDFEAVEGGGLSAEHVGTDSLMGERNNSSNITSEFSSHFESYAESSSTSLPAETNPTKAGVAGDGNENAEQVEREEDDFDDVSSHVDAFLRSLGPVRGEELLVRDEGGDTRERQGSEEKRDGARTGQGRNDDDDNESDDGESDEVEVVQLVETALAPDMPEPPNPIQGAPPLSTTASRRLLHVSSNPYGSTTHDSHESLSSFNSASGAENHHDDDDDDDDGDDSFSIPPPNPGSHIHAEGTDRAPDDAYSADTFASLSGVTSDPYLENAAESPFDRGGSSSRLFDAALVEASAVSNAADPSSINSNDGSVVLPIPDDDHSVADRVGDGSVLRPMTDCPHSSIATVQRPPPAAFEGCSQAADTFDSTPSPESKSESESEAKKCNHNTQNETAPPRCAASYTDDDSYSSNWVDDDGNNNDSGEESGNGSGFYSSEDDDAYSQDRDRGMEDDRWDAHAEIERYQTAAADMYARWREVVASNTNQNKNKGTATSRRLYPPQSHREQHPHQNPALDALRARLRDRPTPTSLSTLHPPCCPRAPPPIPHSWLTHLKWQNLLHTLDEPLATTSTPASTPTSPSAQYERTQTNAYERFLRRAAGTLVAKHVDEEMVRREHDTYVTKIAEIARGMPRVADDPWEIISRRVERARMRVLSPPGSH